MEPFSPVCNLFPELPEQGIFFGSAPTELQRIVRDEMHQRVLRKKYLFTPRSLVDSRIFRAELSVAKTANRVSRYLPSNIAQRLRQFTNLNLNRFDSAFPLPEKSHSPRHTVVKELRFPGKASILKAAYPDANYLVVMRSPHATVHSMLQWFSRGRLPELRRDLYSFTEKLEAQHIGDSYRAQIELARSKGSVAHIAALYWRVSYESLVSELASAASYRLMPYEELARHPVDTTKSIFEWAGIHLSENVSSYLDFSTGNETSNPDAINTVRKSSSYYSAWQKSIEPATREAVDQITEDSFLLEQFVPYYPA